MADLRSIEFAGILPAAGLASRLSPSRYLKELLPVAYVVDDETSTARPIPVVTLSLRALKEAGVRRCAVTVSERKPELMRFLGDGSDFGLQLAYVQQTTPTGLTVAVDMAYEWVKGCYSCLVLPDTIIRPLGAMGRMRQVVEREDTDLVLGVFPTAVPEQLGPVRFNRDNLVSEVLDKPARTDLFNTWAMAIWSPAFADLLHQFAANPATAGKPLGEIFNCAIQGGMKVRAVYFPEGSFVDIGTVRGLSQMVEFSKVLELAEASSLTAVAGSSSAAAPAATAARE
jgi:glucose-1-phosphate thymidylyltransferase